MGLEEAAALVKAAEEQREKEAAEDAARPELEQITCSDASVTFTVPDTKR